MEYSSCVMKWLVVVHVSTSHRVLIDTCHCGREGCMRGYWKTREEPNLLSYELREHEQLLKGVYR